MLITESLHGRGVHLLFRTKDGIGSSDIVVLLVIPFKSRKQGDKREQEKRVQFWVTVFSSIVTVNMFGQK